MLVLSRKVDEEILIGNDIVIRINKIQGSKVQIGIEAPPDVSVLRGELTGKPKPSTTYRVTETDNPENTTENCVT